MISIEIQTLNKIVSSYLKEIHVDVPFFICGGSVFSLIQPNTSYFHDIDVYFYNEDDFKKVESVATKLFSSNNAITVSYKFTGFVPYDISKYKADLLSAFDHGDEHCFSFEIQFIRASIGSPTEVMDTFDLNCSRCCVTSDGEIILGRDYSQNLKVDFENYSGTTLERCIKYTRNKYATDDDKQIENCVKYLIPRLLDVLAEDYNGSERYGWQSLNSAMGIFDDFCSQKIHDKIVEIFSKEDRIKIFTCIRSFLYKNILNPCPEYIVALRKNVDSQKSQSNANKIEQWFANTTAHMPAYDEAINEYPEVFI